MKRMNSLIAAGLISVAGATGALAYDPSQYQSVQNGQRDCAWCDLSGANLSNIDLAGADLSGADLTEADLSGADLRNALPGPAPGFVERHRVHVSHHSPLPVGSRCGSLVRAEITAEGRRHERRAVLGSGERVVPRTGPGRLEAPISGGGGQDLPERRAGGTPLDSLF